MEELSRFHGTGQNMAIVEACVAASRCLRFFWRARDRLLLLLELLECLEFEFECCLEFDSVLLDLRWLLLLLLLLLLCLVDVEVVVFLALLLLDSDMNDTAVSTVFCKQIESDPIQLLAQIQLPKNYCTAVLVVFDSVVVVWYNFQFNAWLDRTR